MNFKELFDREILNEQYVRKELKIFYELKLDLYKPKETTEVPQAEIPPQQQAEIPVQQNEPQPEQPASTEPVPQEQPQQPTEAPEQQPPQTTNPAQETADELKKTLASVVTEDDASINDENRIMRNFEGEVKLSDSQKDNIQTFEDIIDVLSNHKKDGAEVVDEFSAEIITLCANQQFDQIKQKLDKKSKIWVEIYYGYKKDDSVGIRFSKRQNSDTLTSTMLIDNEIVPTKFSIDKINQKVAEYRNYDVKKS
jgi:type IV secretory pathway VirB10-like protein